MANINEIFEELGLIQEPLDEKETFNTLKEILSVFRTYEDTKEENASLRGEIETLRDELEAQKREHRETVKREDTSPKDELLQERSYCRKADDAESADPTVTDVITKSPGVDKLWRITGFELLLPVYNGGPWYKEIKVYYRAFRVDAYGNLQLIDGSSSYVTLRFHVTSPMLIVVDGTLPDTAYS